MQRRPLWFDDYAWHLAGAPNNGIQMIRRRAARPQGHSRPFTGAGQKQGVPAFHFGERKGLAAKRRQDRRHAAEYRRDTKGFLKLLGCGADQPISSLAMRRLSSAVIRR